MQTRAIRLILTSGLFLLVAQSVQAEALRGNNEHARKWNKFADEVLALHNRLVEEESGVIRKTRIGGYSGNEDFYHEEKFLDKETGKVISVVQWERENPKNLHVIEVFVRDDKGRVIRDYTAAYLPNYRNAPTQTLLSLHAYNGNLHAFRSFDAHGERIFERCTGTHKGNDINLMLDEDEIYAALDGNSDAMDQPDYKACFSGLSEEAGKYVLPQ